MSDIAAQLARIMALPPKDRVDAMRGEIERMPRKELIALTKAATDATKGLPWIPSPGPQSDAYNCKADILLYGGEPGGGKGLSIQTLIPTPGGFSTMGQLCAGDEEFDADGAICKVTFVSAIHYRPCFKLTFSDVAKSSPMMNIAGPLVRGLSACTPTRETGVWHTCPRQIHPGP